MLRYFASIRSSSKIRRAPNPIVSPLASRIGHSSRARNRSYGDPPRWLRAASPPTDHLSALKPRARRCLNSVLALARREAQPEGLRRRGVEAALGEELPGLRRVGGQQLLGVVLLRDPVRLDQLAPSRTLGPLLVAVALLALELDAVLLREPLDGLDEGAARRSSSGSR